MNRKVKQYGVTLFREIDTNSLQSMLSSTQKMD